MSPRRTLALSATIAVAAASLAALEVPAALAAPTTTTVSNTAPINPPDNVDSGVTSGLAVTGLSGRILDVNLTLNNVTTTFIGDADIALTSPNGKTSMLFSDSCSGQDWTGQNLVLDDQATTRPLVDDDCTTFGPFQPRDAEEDDPAFAINAPSTLSAFNGVSPNGNWTLRIADDTATDTLKINGGFSLSFTLSDDVAPVVTFTSPPKSSTKNKATAGFTANEAGATFECMLDAQGWKPCTSPYKLKKLSLGKHTLGVRATDADKNVGAPVTATWKVKPPKPSRPGKH